ncbi:MAG: Gfo/Idh/MocA family oxidoreductase [Bryobacteraceae bacterium]
MKSDRRAFLQQSLAAAPLFVPRKVWGANDKPAYGVIATGGRGRYLNVEFLKAGAECAALCDVYEPNLEKAKADAPNAKTYADYHELLEQKGLDFVVLAGPDHHHCPMLLASLKAGKDVYAEKPLSKTLAESKTMIDAVRESKKVVQIGMQRRSAPALYEAKKIIDEGVLGRVTQVKPQWHWNTARPLNNSPLPGKLDWKRFLGSAPNRELEPMRFRYWRYFWDYAGGNMTDQGTHLMDVVLWFMNAQPPQSAIMQGYVAKATGSEHPEVFCSVFEMKDFMVTWELNYCSAYENDWSITFLGDEATLVLDGRGYRIYKEPWPKNKVPFVEKEAPVPLQAHITNFLECIKTRQDPNCTVEIAARAVSGPHLANLSFRKGRKAMLAPDLVEVTYA